MATFITLAYNIIQCTPYHYRPHSPTPIIIPPLLQTHFVLIIARPLILSAMCHSLSSLHPFHQLRVSLSHISNTITSHIYNIHHHIIITRIVNSDDYHPMIACPATNAL